MANRCLQCSKECGCTAFCPHCQVELLERSRRSQKEPVLHDGGGTSAPSDAPYFYPADLSVVDAPQSLIAATHAEALPEEEQRKNTSLLQKGFWLEPAAVYHKLEVEPVAAPVDGHTKPMLSLPRSSTLAVLSSRQKQLHLLRRLFIGLAIFTLLALLVDGGLLALVVIHHQQRAPLAGTPPMISLSPSIVHPGQVAQIHISHFPATAHVLLSRDINAPVRLDQSSSLVMLDKAGEVGVRVLVDKSWGTGTHYIDVEDVSSHYTASTVIHIVSVGQEQPPHLALSEQSLTMGDDFIDANTLQQVLLRNTGGGDISWTASTDQPWLSLAPQQGVFSVQQPVTLAVSRSHLLPGSYQGRVTLYSNAGSVLHVQVAMHVRAWPAHVNAVLAVGPVASSLSGVDGGVDPAGQDLTISNPGTSAMSWSAQVLSPTFATDQKLPLQLQTHWLEAQPASGVIQPGLTETVHVKVHSHTLLPGDYSEVLSFTGDADSLNVPQPVVVALNVQPRCGPVLTMPDSSLTGYAGPGNRSQQNIGIGLPSTCAESLSWSALSLTPWLAISPDHGVLSEHMTLHSSLAADSTHLQPGTYAGTVLFVSNQRTQTVPVQFTVFAQHDKGTSAHSQGDQGMGNGRTQSANKPSSGSHSTALPGQQSGGTSSASGKGSSSGADTPPPYSGTEVLAVSPATLTANVSQGQSAPAQSLALTNTSAVPYYWQAVVDTPELVSLSQSEGILVAGQTIQLTVQSVTSSLDVGSYVAHIALTGSDSNGQAVTSSPQSIPVTVNVDQPCVLQVTPTALSFTATLLNAVPATQQVHLSTTGNCAGPITWSGNVITHDSDWLSLPTTSGGVDTNGVDVDVAVDGRGYLLGSLRGRIVFSASDSNGNAIPVDSSVVWVTLSILT